MNDKIITARLTLKFEKDDENKTYLASQYYKLPLQVLPPHYQDDDGTAFVYLLNPSGGIMQGDHLYTEAYLGNQSSVVITTPSSTKFYKMEDEAAEVENVFYVGEKAVLEYLPEHSVPFNHADVIQRNKYHIAGDSTLIALDCVTSGRKAKGEHFGYKRFCSRSSIWVDEKLVLLDCMDIMPEAFNVKNKGIMEQNDITAGMYLYQKGAADQIITEIRENFRPVGKIKAGATKLSDDLVIIRIMGRSIIDYKDTVALLWNQCRMTMLGKKAVRFRKY